LLSLSGNEEYDDEDDDDDDDDDEDDDEELHSLDSFYSGEFCCDPIFCHI